MQIDRIEKVIVFKGYLWKALILLGYKKWAGMNFQSLAQKNIKENSVSTVLAETGNPEANKKSQPTNM